MYIILYENVKVLHNYTNISKTENNNNSEKIKNEKSNINNNDYINLELNFNKFYNNAISFFKNMKNNNENNEKGISISNKEENKKNLSDKIIPKTAKKNSFDILDDNKINIIDKNNKKKKIYTKTPCKGLKTIEKQKPTKTSKNNKLNLPKKVKDLQIIQIEKTNDNNISNKIVHNPKANVGMTDLNNNEKSENKIKTIEINNKSGNINLLREIDNNRNDKDNSIILIIVKKEKKKLNISIKY